MALLKHTLRKDTLFKLLFTKYEKLLKRLVAELLGIRYEEITEFHIINPEISPEEVGGKFCRLDINMIVNKQRVDLEVQVSDEKNYPERSLFYWAREFSTGIEEGEDYSNLPRTIIISFLFFNQFADAKKFHSEYKCLEVTTHEELTDKMVLHFYEMRKLPPIKETDRGKELWLQLFNARTEEELRKIENMGVPVMSEAVVAFRHISASEEFRAIERARSKAKHDEAQALLNAERKRDEHWKGVVAEKDTAIAEKNDLIAYLQAQLAGVKK